MRQHVGLFAPIRDCARQTGLIPQELFTLKYGGKGVRGERLLLDTELRWAKAMSSLPQHGDVKTARSIVCVPSVEPSCKHAFLSGLDGWFHILRLAAEIVIQAWARLSVCSQQGFVEQEWLFLCSDTAHLSVCKLKLPPQRDLSSRK